MGITARRYDPSPRHLITIDTAMLLQPNKRIWFLPLDKMLASRALRVLSEVDQHEMDFSSLCDSILSRLEKDYAEVVSNDSLVSLYQYHQLGVSSQLAKERLKLNHDRAVKVIREAMVNWTSNRPVGSLWRAYYLRFTAMSTYREFWWVETFELNPSGILVNCIKPIAMDILADRASIDYTSYKRESHIELQIAFPEHSHEMLPGLAAVMLSGIRGSNNVGFNEMDRVIVATLESLVMDDKIVVLFSVNLPPLVVDT